MSSSELFKAQFYILGDKQILGVIPGYFALPVALQHSGVGSSITVRNPASEASTLVSATGMAGGFAEPKRFFGSWPQRNSAARQVILVSINCYFVAHVHELRHRDALNETRCRYLSSGIVTTMFCQHARIHVPN